MATWTDGAAYAPTERPDGFATPEVAPLAAAPPMPAPTPGPLPPPTDFAPVGPQTPLDAIGGATTQGRNPTQPFATTAAMLTARAEDASGRRDPRTPFVGVGGTEVAQLPPPSGPPLLAPATASPTGNRQALATMPPPQGAHPSPPGMAPWGPPVPTLSAGGASARELGTTRTYLKIAIGSLLLGAILPGAVTLFTVTAGLLLLRTRRHTGPLATVCLLVGLALLGLQWLLGDLGALSPLASLSLTVWAAIRLQSLTRKSG